MRVAGDVVSSGAKIAAHAAPLLLGLGKKTTEWNSLVAKVRKEKGLSLKETLKYKERQNWRFCEIAPYRRVSGG